MQHLDTCLKERHLSATVIYHLSPGKVPRVSSN